MIKADVKIGENCFIPHPELVNLYGCTIGNNCKIGSFVEIRKGVKIGNNCKIQAGVFIPGGVTIEDNVFLGPQVVFTNDKYPRATNEKGELLTEEDWEQLPTTVKKGASLGANCTIICGVTIGEGALVGAGSVVTRDVPKGAVVYGNPAKQK